MEIQKLVNPFKFLKIIISEKTNSKLKEVLNKFLNLNRRDINIQIIISKIVNLIQLKLYLHKSDHHLCILHKI